MADEHGHYQTISIHIDAVSRNGTQGNYIERGLEVKNASVSELVRIPPIINAGKLREIAIASFIHPKLKLLFGDDAGNLHVIENDKILKSIKLSTEVIVGLSVQQLGTIYYASTLFS